MTGATAGVLIRPIESSDGPALVDGFERLSPQSRRARFLAGKAELSAAELRYFTDVDHHDHEALIAVSPVDGRAVGTARFIRDTADPGGADVAVTVVDEWHRRGIATALVGALVARAEDENVRYFSAHVAEENLPIIHLLQRADADVRLVDQAEGVRVYRISNFRRNARHADSARITSGREPADQGQGGPQHGCCHPAHGESILM